MKKIFNKYTIISILLFSFIVEMRAQEEKESKKPTSTINVVARYLDVKNKVEMRFFPDKRAVLYTGIRGGFIIERADITILPEGVDSIDGLKFIKIGETKAYSESEWIEASSKANSETKHDLELAKDFFDAMDTKKGGSFNFEEGIKEMKEQKSAEDFEYLIFVMNAIKNDNVARALGLDFKDEKVEKNKTYIYRVRLVKQPKLYKTVSAPFRLETKVKQVDKERKIYVKQGDTKLSFMWEEDDMISGALVERKNKKTGKWESLTSAPIYTLGNTIRNGFNDEGLTNYVTYEYRFYGFTSFGEKVLFGTASGMPKDLTPPKKPIFKLAKHTKPNEVTIKWEVQKPEDGDLKGFIIARGDSNRGKFSIIHQNLLGKSSREFKDKTFKKGGVNYYIVQAVDTAGNISSTTPAFVTLIDSIPPMKPKFLKGKIDSLGVVTLDVVLNKERDLMGYRLFKSNSDKHEFSAIQEGFNDNDSIPKPVQVVFKDTVTLNSLTPYIYYRIKALDRNFNQSEYSDILKVKRPDKIAPTTPVFKNVIVRKDEVELHFALSESKDVVAQYIYKKLKMDSPWELLSNLEKGENVFIDKNLKQGVKYYYSLRAKDDSGNYSKYATAVYGRPYDNGVRPVVENLEVTSKGEKVNLKWNYPKKYKNTYFVIYKKDRNKNLVQYKNTDKHLFEEVLEKGKYTYAVRAFTKDGGQSKVSELKTVKID